MIERTFAMIKPRAVQERHSGKIIDRIEQEGFSILGLEKVHLTRLQAEKLYAIHRERSFFGEMLDTITSSPAIIMALEKENAIKAWRDLMGATNPAQAEPNTLRKLFGVSISDNGTHGSDSLESARTELEIFFPSLRRSS
jgi:nucleoside-diphosphate kinase